MARAMPSPIYGVDDTLGFDDLVGPHDAALELLVGLERADLLLAAPQQGEALEVAAVGRQQGDLEVLDLAVALEPSPVLDALVEYLDSALLASAYHLTPPDEQCGISHWSLL